MTLEQLSQAKDKDLPASLIAMRRAARMAREHTIQTDTAAIVMRDKKLVRITAEGIAQGWSMVSLDNIARSLTGRAAGGGVRFA